jgi:hypothetical protein
VGEVTDTPLLSYLRVTSYFLQLEELEYKNLIQVNIIRILVIS